MRRCVSSESEKLRFSVWIFSLPGACPSASTYCRRKKLDNKLILPHVMVQIFYIIITDQEVGVYDFQRCKKILLTLHRVISYTKGPLESLPPNRYILLCSCMSSKQFFNFKEDCNSFRVWNFQHIFQFCQPLNLK
jgi:hypothetical protein